MDVTFFEEQSYFTPQAPLQGEKTSTNEELPELPVSNLPVLNPFEILGTLDEGLGNPNPPAIIDDLDIPIATRKGVRSCTQHPISKFVSYSRLSPPYKTFVSNLPSVFVPNHVQMHLWIPNGRVL